MQLSWIYTKLGVVESGSSIAILILLFARERFQLSLSCVYAPMILEFDLFIFLIIFWTRLKIVSFMALIGNPVALSSQLYFKIFNRKVYQKWKGKVEVSLRHLKLAYMLNDPCSIPAKVVSNMIKQSLSLLRLLNGSMMTICKNHI